MRKCHYMLLQRPIQNPTNHNLDTFCDIKPLTTFKTMFLQTSYSAHTNSGLYGRFKLKTSLTLD